MELPLEKKHVGLKMLDLPPCDTCNLNLTAVILDTKIAQNAGLVPFAIYNKIRPGQSLIF